MMIWHLNKDLKEMRRDSGGNWGDKTQQGSLRYRNGPPELSQARESHCPWNDKVFNQAVFFTGAGAWTVADS